MLPMDEKFDVNTGCFYIDLNSRNINVPAMYTKYGVSVTGDQLAETLMFKVPRYFDYTDLTSTEIYVQWTNPAGEEGASRIVLVDYIDVEQDTIIFGWPLTSNITVEGKNPLKFSVRFFIRNEEGEIKYSLNTLPASVNIKQALYTDFNANLTVDDPASLFAEAVRNGVSTNIDLPEAPAFFHDWLLPKKVMLANDTANIQVQGGAADNGIIFYKWYYYPRYIEDNKVVTKDKGEYLTMKTPTGCVYVESDDPSKELGPVENKTYYTYDGQGAYTPHAGPFEAGVTYYESVASYTIPNSEVDTDLVPAPNTLYWPHVTGEYHVILQNKIGTTAMDIPAEYRCVLPCIEKVDFASNLGENAILEGEEDKTALLYVDVETNEPDDAQVTYSWSRRLTANGEFETIEGAVNANYTVTEPGWYKVTATGILNREKMTADSEICKVAHIISDPDIKTYLVDNVERSAEVGSFIPVDVEGHGNVTLTVNIADLSDPLMSDKVIYKWFRHGVDDPTLDTDSDENILDKDDTDVVSVDGNSITVYRGDKAYMYFCTIQNILGDQKSKIVTSKQFQVI